MTREQFETAKPIIDSIKNAETKLDHWQNAKFPKEQLKVSLGAYSEYVSILPENFKALKALQINSLTEEINSLTQELSKI